MRGRIRLVVAALAAWVVAMPAQAAWLEATTRHFVLYADMGEKQLRAKAVRLERLDQVLRRFMKRDDPAEAASNRLTVFWTAESDIRALCRCDNAAGFYQASVGGSAAFSGRGPGGDGTADWSQVVLFHEYAHHFLLGSYDLAFPSWYSEGFAEFAGTTTFDDDVATLGVAAQHRAQGLFNGHRFTATQLFDPAVWTTLKDENADAFYGSGWLMTHYLTFDNARFAQFRDYVARLNRGMPSLDAARAAFGDLKALDHELVIYLRQRRIPGMRFPLSAFPTPDVTVRALGDGEAALIRMRMTSVRGVDQKSAAALYQKAAPVAARYPDDPVAQGWLAEMAYDAGDDTAALAAADRALAKDPASVQGLLYRGRIAIRRLVAAKTTDAAAWTAARKSILAANRIDPDDAEPMWLFWQTFAQEGRPPRPSALAGLYRAQEMVPQDSGVRLSAIIARLTADEKDEARRLLGPLAYDPHGGADNIGMRMLAALDAGKSSQEVLKAGGMIVVPSD